MLTHTSHACTSGRVNPSAGPYLHASCDVGQPHRNPLSEGQEAKEGRCSLFGAKSRPLRPGSGRSRYSRWIPSIGRQATNGSVALLAASVVVSGLIEAADPNPRGLLSRSPDLPSRAALLVLVTTRSCAGYRREDPGPRVLGPNTLERRLLPLTLPQPNPSLRVSPRPPRAFHRGGS
jgi:hypothetical protein